MSNALLQRERNSENPLKANYTKLNHKLNTDSPYKNDYVSILLIVCSNYFKSLLQPITVKVVYTPLLSYWHQKHQSWVHTSNILTTERRAGDGMYIFQRAPAVNILYSVVQPLVSKILNSLCHTQIIGGDYTLKIFK